MIYFLLGLSVFPVLLLVCFVVFKLAVWRYEKDAIKNGATNASS